MVVTICRTTFSPSGKLVQIEYALAAVAQGVTSLGIKASDGVVIATERRIPSVLLEPDSIEKVMRLTPDIGAVYSGLGPDFRVLVDKARKLSHTKYKRIYEEYPPTRIMVQDIAKVMQEATQSGGVRPFGVTVLVAGWDEENGPQLFQADPSGSYFQWKATAVGRGAVSAKAFLEKRYNSEMILEDAIHTALLALKESFEGEISSETVEVGIVGLPEKKLLGYSVSDGSEGPGPRFRTLTKQELDDYLQML